MTPQSGGVLDPNGNKRDMIINDSTKNTTREPWWLPPRFKCAKILPPLLLKPTIKNCIFRLPQNRIEFEALDSTN
jgi:hypothetical protein